MRNYVVVLHSYLCSVCPLVKASLAEVFVRSVVVMSEDVKIITLLQS